MFFQRAGFPTIVCLAASSKASIASRKDRSSLIESLRGGRARARGAARIQAALLMKIGSVTWMASAALVALTFIAGSVAYASPTCPVSPSYSPDFTSYTTCLVLNGNASFQGSQLQITPATTGQIGSAWYATAQPVGSSFSSTFTFQLTDGSADGFAFIVQNSPAGTSAIGADGCAMGFADDPLPGNNYFCGGPSGGIPNSLAIGFKTYNDDGTEYPPGNSVFIASNGTNPNCENVPNGEGAGSFSCVIAENTLASPSITLADGNTHTVTVTYTTQPSALQTNCSASAGCLDVILDGNDLFPSGVSFSMSSIGLTNNSAYVGFTGATGGYFENSSILNWTLTPQSFGNITVCTSGTTTPAPCSSTLPETFNIAANTTIGSVKVVTQGAPGLDFTQASGGSCTGTFSTAGPCTVNVTFAPVAPGLRAGAVELLDGSGNILATQMIYGVGQGPAVAFSPGVQSNVSTNGLSGPSGVAVDAAGDIFFADSGHNRVEEVPFGGVQTTVPLTGLSGPSGLSGPYDVALDGAGNVFIADFGNNRVVKVTPGGSASTVPTTGLSHPTGVAVDGAGDVFITDSGNNRVVEVLPSGAQTTVPTSGLHDPFWPAVDAAGDVFFEDDPGNGSSQQVLKVTPAGVQSTVTVSGLYSINGIAVDAAGDVYVADQYYDEVVEVTPGGTQSTVATNGLKVPAGLAVDGSGDLFIADNGDSRVVEVAVSSPPSLSFAATTVGSTSTNSPQEVSVANVGNAALDLSAVTYPTDFPEAPGVATDCTSSSSLLAGGTCTLSIDFTPTMGSATPGTLLSETVSVTDNALNATNAKQGVSVTGTAIELQVPNVVGDSSAAATSAITTAGLVAGTPTSAFSNTVPSGDVISESPVAGTPVAPESTVNFVVSNGPAQVMTPSVVNFALAAAESTITTSGLVVGTVTNQYSDTVASGTVISQNPNGGITVNAGTSINLVVSSGQPPSTDQLTLENNYFVTGDYATGGITLHGTGSGSITISDSTTNPGTQGVPDGADIIADYLYWTTVENTATPSGMNGTFLGYPISGLQVGADQPNYSDGTYTGTLRVYRADVNTYLPILAGSTNGVRIASGSFAVTLPNGGASGLPVTEGASLVVIYRVLSRNFPLKSVLLYNGSVIPTSNTGVIPQAMQGFYDAVGGASGTGEVTNLFTASGSWSDSESSQTLGQSNEYIDNLSVGNAYAAAIVSTPVNNSDGDGILNVWKANQGYTDVKTGQFVSLAGATAGHKDLFVQFDYMCSALLADGVTCDFTLPNQYPSPDAQGNDPLAITTQAFLNSGVYLHLKPGNAILESTYTCTDSASVLCEFPSTASVPQPGVVAWNGGVELSKIWPANFNACTASPSIANCATRFPLGQKDSYHYVLFGYSLAIPAWNSWFGSLTNITVSNGATSLVTTGLGSSCPTRVTISGVLGNPNLNGVYATNGCDSGLTTIYLTTPSTVPNWTYPNQTLPEPTIGITSGTVSSISGYSDVGGSDSVVSLGLWAQNPNQDMSKPATVIAGTLFHELGHTLGLTHGGLYFDTPGSYIPTYEVNCKPNYQSTMNYLFQLDGVGSTGTIAYSSQTLGDQNQNPLTFATLGNVTSLTDISKINAVIGSSSWYVPYNAATTTASPATMHCDGTPLNNANDLAVRVNGTVDPLSPTWTNNENITFDGPAYTTLRGYNDLNSLDLRQVGASSETLTSLANLTSYSSSGVTIGGGGGVTIGGGGGVTIGGGGGVTIGGGGGVTIGGGGGVTIGGGGGVTIGGGGGVTIGGGGGVTIGGGGGAPTELDYVTANSVVRPPSSPGMTPSPAGVPPYVVITWNAPAFGVVETYTIYRSVNGAPAVAVGSVSGVNGNPPGTTWTDFNPQTGTVVYTITTTLYPVPIDPTARQSQPSPPAVLKSEQTISLSLPASVSMSSSPVTITATAETNGSANGLQVSFVGTGSCSIGSQTISGGVSSASVNLDNTGTCYIAASQSGSSTYDSASPVSGSFQIQSSGSNNQSQTINLSQLPGVQYGSGFSVSATSSSGVGVTFAASGPCTVGATAGTATGTTTGAGKCTITATALANGNYGTATTVQSFPVYQAVLDVTAFSPTVMYGQPIPGLTYTLTGYVGSDATANPPAVKGTPSLSTAAATGSAPGSYPITVSTGTLASANYSFLYVNGNVIIQQASQAITFTQKAPSAAAYNSSFTVIAKGGASGMPVTFSSSGPCTITGTGTNSATYTINSSSGTCSVIANQLGNTDYAAAQTVTELVNANGPALTINPTMISFGSVSLGSITTKTITLTSAGTSPVTINDPILSLVQGGNSDEFIAVNLCPSSLAVGNSCTITIAFVAGPFYNQQTAVLQIMDNAPGNPQKVTLSATVLQPQTITFATNPPATAAYGSNFTVAASASSGLGVTYTSSGACSNSGAMYTMTSGTGTCSVTASQAGNLSYAAATPVTRTVFATLASQTIKFTTPPPSSAAYKTSFTVVATGGPSGNPVTYTSSGACSNAGATYTMTSGTGKCSVIASQAANSDYAAATPVTETVSATYSVATLSPNLSFGTVASNKSSSLPVTLTNVGTTPLIISSIGITGTNSKNFSETNNCPSSSSSLAAGKYCTITVTFNSTGKSASADLTVTDNTQTGTQSITLAGN